MVNAKSEDHIIQRAHKISLINTQMQSIQKNNTCIKELMCYSCEREYIKTIHKCKKNGKEIVEINEYIDGLERRKVSHIHCQRIGHWLRPKN